MQLGSSSRVTAIGIVEASAPSRMSADEIREKLANMERVVNQHRREIDELNARLKAAGRGAGDTDHAE